MPSWKKLIVSGSDATLNSLQVTTNVTAAAFSGSFSGSFQGDGSGLTNISVEIAEIASFPQTFSNTSSVLVNHDLDTSYPLVQVYNGDDEQLIPLRIKIINSSSVQVDFSSNQSGYVIVAKGGHIISGTAGNAALLEGQPGSYYLDYNNFTNIPAGLVSGSDQLTGSYDLRYVLSGSITQTTWDNIANKPPGIVSSSAQIATEISGAFTSVSQSIASDIANLVLDSGSFSIRITDLENFSASLDNNFVSETEFASATGSFLTTASISDDTITLTKGDGTTFNLVVDNVNSASFAFTASYVDWGNIDNVPVGIISSSAQLNNSTLTGMTISGSFSGSFQGNGSQLTFSGTGILSSSAQIASEISGAFTSVSESIALDIAGLVQDSGSFSTRITDLENFSSSADSIFVSEVEFALASGSFLVTASISDDTITVTKGDGTTFNLIVNNVQNATSASYATFAETAPLDQLIGTTFSASNFTFPQDLTVQGKITAQEFHTELISSSIIYESGSTKFGDTFDDTHQFTGSISVTGSLSVNDYTLPITDGIYPNSVVITNAAGVLEFDIPKTIYEEVKNVSGGPLVKGTPVYVVSTTGNTNNVAPADALDPAKMPASFILEQALNDDEEGLGIILGFINGIDTSGLTAGQIVYVAPGGGYTQTRPTGSALVQALGIPVKIDPTNGSGIIFNPGTSLDLPNIEPGYFWVGDTNSVPTSASVASLRTGSYTGSFFGDGSGLVNLISASHAVNADTASLANFATTAGTANTASYVDWTDIDNVPVGIVSSSAQIASDISGSFTSVSQSIASDIAGLVLDSGSFSTRITDLENFSASLDSDFVSETEFALASGSFLTTASISDDTITLTKGDGSTFNLIVNNVENATSASYVNWIDIDNVPAGIISSSAQLNNSTLTGMIVSGSFSGSFQGDGSGLTGITVDIGTQTTIAQAFTTTSSVTVNHLLNTAYPLVQVYNGLDEQVIPQRIKILNSSSVQVDFPTQQTGYVVVAKGGHIVSGTAANALLLEGQSGSYYLDYNNFTNVPAVDPFPYTGSAIISGSLIVTGSVNATSFTGDGSGLTGVGAFPFTGSAGISGSLTIDGTLTATTIVETSSERFKENINDLPSSLDHILGLRPVTFNRIGSDRPEVGFIAEQAYNIYPEIVVYDEHGRTSGIEYSRLTAPLVKAIQDLAEIIRTQDQKIQDLAKKIDEKA